MLLPKQKSPIPKSSSALAELEKLIADEETKFGFDANELNQLTCIEELKNIQIVHGVDFKLH